MLAAAAANAGIAEWFDAVLSVEEVSVYKPHLRSPAACDRSTGSDGICFVSSMLGCLLRQGIWIRVLLVQSFPARTGTNPGPPDAADCATLRPNADSFTNKARPAAAAAALLGGLRPLTAPSQRLLTSNPCSSIPASSDLFFGLL